MTAWRAAAAAAAAIWMLAGCGPSRDEKKEALELAKLLRKIRPEMRELLDAEVLCANQLKITLEELGSKDFQEFRQNFDTSVGTMAVIRQRRRELQEKVRQGLWVTPLVHVVQGSALMEFQDDLSRTEGWIALAQSVRTRADMGRQREFPEVATLKRKLEFFVGEALETPLSRQLEALVAEYKFTEAEIAP
jgi:hypothetical protein